MANEKRLDLIDRQALIESAQKKTFAIGDNTNPYKALEIQGKYFRECIDNAPTVDAVEVVHGRWDPHASMTRTPFAMNYDCSVCGNESAKTTNYCPNCGAKMDGGNEDG